MILFWALTVLLFVFGVVVFRGAPYVPSHRRYAKVAFTELYPLRPKDVLVDLGSGDGVILRLASEKGAKAIGYELNPILVFVSWILARGDKRQSILLGDMWLMDFPAETTIVYVFSVTRDAKKLTKKLQAHADAHGRELYCVTYGPELKDIKPLRKRDAHSLYHFLPKALHDTKA